MKRLRDRIKMLETDNASMHLKLSKTQQDVNQRLTEIEMQMDPGLPGGGPQSVIDEVFDGGGSDQNSDSPGENSNAALGIENDDNENNIESFI